MPAYPQSSVAARSMEDIKDSYEEYRQHKDDTNRLQQRYYDMMIKLNS
jgi:hypothetical protein